MSKTRADVTAKASRDREAARGWWFPILATGATLLLVLIVHVAITFPFPNRVPAFVVLLVGFALLVWGLALYGRAYPQEWGDY